MLQQPTQTFNLTGYTVCANFFLLTWESVMINVYLFSMGPPPVVRMGEFIRHFGWVKIGKADETQVLHSIWQTRIHPGALQGGEPYRLVSCLYDDLISTCMDAQQIIFYDLIVVRLLLIKYQHNSTLMQGFGNENSEARYFDSCGKKLTGIECSCNLLHGIRALLGKKQSRFTTDGFKKPIRIFLLV